MITARLTPDQRHVGRQLRAKCNLDKFLLLDEGGGMFYGRRIQQLNDVGYEVDMTKFIVEGLDLGQIEGVCVQKCPRCVLYLGVVIGWLERDVQMEPGRSPCYRARCQTPP